jgi:hypothetical protein
MVTQILVNQALSSFVIILMPMQMSMYCRTWAAVYSAS